MKTNTRSETTSKSRAKADTGKNGGAKAPSRTRKKSASKTGEAAASAPAVSASQEEVAQLAYSIYQERIANGIPGDAVADWYAAEAMILEGAELALAV